MSAESDKAVASGPILGIDPGSVHTGYGVIDTSGDRVTALAYGAVSPKTTWELPRRLAYIHRSILDIIVTFKPKAMVLEDIFNYKNVKSTIKLAHARAASILAASLSDIPVYEYSPTLIKNAVSGSGRADKSQVAFMVTSILNLEGNNSPDATDALAVALCHAGQESLPLAKANLASNNRGSSWRRLSPKDLEALGYKIDPDS
jgi:crossover junction endodeoxyribonuclease RuvC